MNKDILKENKQKEHECSVTLIRNSFFFCPTETAFAWRSQVGLLTTADTPARRELGYSCSGRPSEIIGRLQKDVGVMKFLWFQSTFLKTSK